MVDEARQGQRTTRLRASSGGAGRLGGVGAGCVAAVVVWLFAVQAADGQARAGRPSLSPQQQEQLDNYRHLIIGPNSPRARRYGASELMATGWPQAVDELRSILSGSDDVAARLAVAEAIALAAEPPTEFIEPLIELLASDEVKLRKAAAGALRNYKDSGVASRLGRLARDSRASFAQRLAAIEALSGISDKNAIDALIQLLDDSHAEIRAKTIAALHAVTGISKGQDIRAWKRWWQSNRSKTRLQWISELNDVLTKKNTALQEELQLLRARLRKTLMANYQLTPEANRTGLLIAWLKDPLADVRLLGLEQVRAMVTARKPLPEPISDQIRELVADPSAAVRAAVMVVLRYPPNRPEDGRLILGRLGQETDSQVKRAILATLGRVGQKEAVGPISDAVDDPAEAVAAEAATALASLVERRKVDAAELDQAVERLKKRLEQIPVENWQLRQPFVEAMARIGHEAFRDVFMSCLDKTNRPTIRQAAIRGLSKLGKAGVGKLLIEALGDSDAGVRQAAAEGLGRLGNAGAAEALFERLAPSIEPDPNVQAEAWKSFVRLYQASSAQEQLAWLKRIDAAADATWAQRFVELAKLAEGQLGSGGADFWAVQRDWGRALMTLQRYQEAAERLAAAYELASSSGDGQAGELAVMVVDAWLRAGEIDKASEYASRLLQGGSEKLREAILELLRGQVEAALKAGQAETSLALLKRVDELFGQDLEASWKETFARARARAERLGREKDAALLRQAIARLRGSEADQARKQIMELGRRAVPQLAAELMRLIRSENHDVALEKALLEILTELAPEWQGYDLKLPVDQKCSRLQELARPED